ncbi:Frag1/DRAM/Sfk1 family-domain-containing protein [Boletus coccyginus]|nr:Frag1/DRAM/Sfk1 family-domain-containing protein [Boletus coccyginus]
MSARTKHSTPTAVNRKTGPLLIDASRVAAAHTYLAFSAFASALLLGCALHYKKIVKNGIAGYPEEWFPSVSATIGDWYPERNVFQILIAITSGPRFALVFLQYLMTRTSRSTLPRWVFLTGIIRTLACGGWVYITSNDDHDAHDVLMVLYIVCNVPWMLGGIMTTPTNHVQVRKRRFSSFFALIIPLVYFFIQHKVHRIPGAYTRYAFFEWGLIFLDVLYDSISGADFKHCNLQASEPLPPHDNKLTSVDGDAPELNDTKVLSTAAKVKTQAALASDKPKSDARVGETVSRGWKQLTPLMNSTLRPWLSFAADVYLSYLFWSIVTSLLTTLFYFSVWELGLSGAEAALFTYLTPTLLGITPIRNWAATKWGRVTLRVLSLVGLAAYKIDDPLGRLWAVIGANVAVLLSQVAEWTAGDAAYQGFLLGVGLVLSSLSKHANHSNNPVWPMLNEETGGYNKTGLVVAVCAILELATRPSSPPVDSEEGRSGGPEDASNNAKVIPRNWMASSIALGSLFFTLHCMFSDSSTIIAWSWTGYQDGQPRGPLPHLHGSITLIAQSLGLIISAVLPTSAASALLSHPLWFVYGCASAFVMYYFRDWAGFLGGLNFAIFCMSILPSVLSQSSAWQGDKVGRRLFVTFFVAILFYLANVWTVAYAFVPGGPYLRERTDLVLIAQLLAILLAFRSPFGASTRTNFLPGIPSSTRTRVPAILCLLSLISVLVTLFRWPPVGPRPFKPGTRIFNAGIWTIHFGIDNAGHDSQRRIRDVIRDMQLDVVGLLETDLHRTVYGNRDLTRVAAEELGYYVDLGPGPNLHTWGAALLCSQFPIIHSHHHLLPSPHGELAPAIEAVLDVHGTEITVVVSHNGQEEDPLDRELQSKELARIMAASYPRPVVFLGYVVSKPLTPRPAPYDILVNDGLLYDIDPEDLDRWCEYILYRGLYRTAYARVSRGIVTDTELQIGQFVLPKHGFTLANQTEESRLLRAWKEDLPEYHWFPMEYYGNEHEGGVNGHYYHVFDTPLYYQLPDGAVL